MRLESSKIYHCQGSECYREPTVMRRIINLALFVFVFAAVSDPGRIAHAYLDPGTGGIILQMLLGGAAGVMVVAKLYWHQFTSFFRRTPEPHERRSEVSPE